MDLEDKYSYVHPFVLISEVKKYPALYNNRMPEYANTSMKEEIWKSINAVLFPNYKKLDEKTKNVIKETVRERWKQLNKSLLEDQTLRNCDPIYKKTNMNPIVKAMQFVLPDVDSTLASEVKKYPALYNDEIPEYNNTPLKEEIWESISAILSPNYNELNDDEKGATNEKIRRRWAVLRFNLIKDLRLRNKDLKYRKTEMTPIVQQLQFLIPYMNKHDTWSFYTEFEIDRHGKPRYIDPNDLISQVKKYPALYDDQIPEYSNETNKEEIWDSINAALFPNFKDMHEEEKSAIRETVRKRWKSLRSKVMNDYRLRKYNLVYRQKNMSPLLEEMQFIIPNENNCNNRSNFDTNQIDNELNYIDPLSLALISEVKQYPELYDNGIPDKIGLMKEEIWELIITVLFPIYNESNDETKAVIKENVLKRWRSLRGALVRDNRLRKNDPVYRRKKMTPEIKEMQFLVPYLNTDKSNFPTFPEDFRSIQDHVVVRYVAPIALISEVKKYPALYNKWIPEYRNEWVKKKIWESIYVALFPNYKDLDEKSKGDIKETVGKRWKTLRSSVVKDQRLRQADPVYELTKMNPIVEEMRFIIPFIKRQKMIVKQRRTNVEPDHLSHSYILTNDSTIVSKFQEEPQDSYAQVYDDEEQSTNEDSNPSAHMTMSEVGSEEGEWNADVSLSHTIEVEETETNPEERKLIHKRKRANSEQDLHSKLSELIDICNEDSDDEEQMFLLALLSDFKKIPVEKKLKVKKAFITALDDALE